MFFTHHQKKVGSGRVKAINEVFESTLLQNLIIIIIFIFIFYFFYNYRLQGCSIVHFSMIMPVSNSIFSFPLFSASNQSVDHILQFHTACRAPGQENHRARLLLLLHSRPYGSGTQESRVSRLSQWTVPELGLLRQDIKK